MQHVLCYFVQALIMIAFSYSSDGTDTPYSRLLGKAPIMVAGMTPPTAKGGFASAILSAGFYVEFAGGGHYDAAVSTFTFPPFPPLFLCCLSFSLTTR
jgi:hypothetical protein